MDVKIRNYRSEDLDQLVQLVRATSDAEWSPAMTRSDLEQRLSRPCCDPTEDTFVAVVRNGGREQVVGVHDFFPRWKRDDPVQILQGKAVVQPDYLNHGLLDRLMRPVWRRCAVHVDAAGRERFIFQMRCTEDQTDMRETLKRLGFAVDRHLAEMERRDLRHIPPPSVPEGISIRPYRLGLDDRAWHDAFQDAFADHWGQMVMTFDQWQHAVRHGNRDPSLHAVAWDADQVVGFCYCKMRDDVGSIRWLGVRSAWQRRGLGGALMQIGLRALRAAGARRVLLGVDLESETKAAALYRRQGFEIAARQLVFHREFSADEVRGLLDETTGEAG